MSTIGMQVYVNQNLFANYSTDENEVICENRQNNLMLLTSLRRGEEGGLDNQLCRLFRPHTETWVRPFSRKFVQVEL